jgi:polar amino acid transport system substrate-binding protein
MKKIFALILCMATLMCLFTGCGPKGKTLDEIKKAGKLVVATSPDFPPFESLEGGNVVGIEVDIMKLICNELGVEFVIEKINFDAVLTGVQTGKYDCGMSGISVTPKREKNTLFTACSSTRTQLHFRFFRLWKEAHGHRRSSENS